MFIMEQTAPLDFPIPNEIIEIMMAYLSPEELFVLAAIGTDRLKKFALSVLRKKLCELPKLLCQMSFKGDIEKIKQVFEYVKQESISVEEMGVKNNEVNQGKKPTLVDTNSGYRGSTPLMEAAANGHHLVCDYLITVQNANIEAKDDDKRTALICAARNNETEVIRVLLNHKINIKAKSKGGFNAAYWAVSNGNLDALKMLIEKDGDVIDLKGWQSEPRLIVGLREEWVDVCKYLIEENNTNVSLKNTDGDPASEYAKMDKVVDFSGR